MITNEQIENWFVYHPPNVDQKEAYEEIREDARSLAYTIVALCPPSADTTAAIRKLRECVMTANAAIATEIKE